jgi:stringent starvation protein B
MTSNRPYLVRAILDWICDNNLTPLVFARADVEGAKIPPGAIADGGVVLNIGPSAVTRFEINLKEMSFLARFSGVSHYVVIPMSAVVALRARENGQGMMFGDEFLAAEDLDAATDGTPTEENAAPVQESAPVPPSPPSAPAKRPSHLKVIK